MSNVHEQSRAAERSISAQNQVPNDFSRIPEILRDDF
jgi:hypothetical protein